MALTLETFVNFESGTLYECEYTEDCEIVTDPAPPYEHETYVAKLGEGDSAGTLYTPIITSTANKFAIGFRIRFDVSGSPAHWIFFAWREPGNELDFHLERETDGELSVYDANGDLVSTTSNPVFATDTWYLVELLFTHGDPGALVIHIDGVAVHDSSGEDYDGSS